MGIFQTTWLVLSLLRPNWGLIVLQSNGQNLVQGRGFPSMKWWSLGIVWVGLECRGLAHRFKKSLISRMLWWGSFRNPHNLLGRQTEIIPTRGGGDLSGQIHKDIYLSCFLHSKNSIFVPPKFGNLQIHRWW